jgi:hypothetical protein
MTNDVYVLKLTEVAVLGAVDDAEDSAFAVRSTGQEGDVRGVLASGETGGVV